MINKVPLRCDSCDGITLTRTAIGHRPRQTHRFPCPGCGIEIVYALVLDQQIGDSHYEEPRNAHWLDDVQAEATVDDHLAVLTFDSELLTPRQGLFSPFMAAKDNFRDYREFERHEVLRHNLRTNLWDPLRQLLSHFETGRDDLFARVAEKRFARNADGDTRIDRLSLLHDVTADFLQFFTYEFDHITQEVGGRMGDAYRADEGLLREFAQQIVNSGLAAELWREIHDLHREFMDVWESLSPMLNLRYWEDAPEDLADYSVTTKDFERIRHFFLSCYETLARISVLAIGVEAIVHHRELSIPKRKGTLSVMPEFSELANARKEGHLAKYPPLDELFVPHMASPIRNGIGHNSSFYDFAGDEVVCVKSLLGTIEEVHRESYTSFCRRVLDLISSIVRLELYLYMLLMLVGGEHRQAGSRMTPDMPPDPPRGAEGSMRYRTI